jgi:hypothetical protein
MRLTRVVHVKSHLLDCVGDVRSGESEVPESPDLASVGNWVADRSTHDEDLGLGVHRRGASLAVAHANMLNDIPSVLVLVQEEIVVSLRALGFG